LAQSMNNEYLYRQNPIPCYNINQERITYFDANLHYI